jgi:hypothetical protein
MSGCFGILNVRAFFFLNGFFLTSIGVSEFYNTQIDEMPLNVACVFIYSLLVAQQLINDICSDLI